jgi:hypothetical protein
MMSSIWRVLGSAAVVLAAMVVVAADIRLPDVSKGEINGKVAILAWPISGVEVNRAGGAGARAGKLLTPEQCSAYLVSTQDLEHELVYPCGKWFQPAVGRYRMWLEGPDLSTAGYGIVDYDAEPFQGRGMAMMFPLNPAGRVALSKTVVLRPEMSFRLLQIRGVLPNGILPGPFDRRVRAEIAYSGVQMGTGSVFAAIFDRKTDDAIALAPPIAISVGKTVQVAPALPSKGTDVLVILERPRIVDAGEEEIALSLELGEKAHKPDVFMNTATHVFGIWYGVEGRSARLRVNSTALRYAGGDFILKPNKVVTVRAKLQKLPSIGVSIHVPDGVLRNVETSVEVFRAGSRTALRTARIHPGESIHLESLPAELLNVVLNATPWEFAHPIDLSSGLDGNLVFDLQPIVISGTVYYGRDVAPEAEVAFEVDRGWIRTTSDETGKYQLVFWRPASEYRAEVRIKNRSGPPFTEAAFDEATTIDFHIPRTDFTVNVVDASTRKPIAGAKVLAGNRWSGHSGSSAVQTTVTNDEGYATLQPMREGEMIIRAQAAGYLDAAPVRHTVESIDAQRRFEIELHPVGETRRVTVRAPDGRAALGASVWAVQSTDGYQPPLWRDSVGSDGILAIPRTFRNALFLIHYPGAAGAVRRLNDDEEATWNLAPAAPPITIDTRKQARLALWIDGVRMTGAALHFVTGSMEATDAQGLWSAENLPPQPFRMLAWQNLSPGEISSGAYDAVATAIPYPWPPIIEVRPLN